MPPTDEWTTAHDLALIYSGLACMDRELTDEEIAAIEAPLTEWIPLSADMTPEVVVQEAAVALKQSQQEVRKAVQRVGEALGPDERRDALRHLLRIAQADGVILGAERGLIRSLATTWALKHLGDGWGENSSAIEERRGEDWSTIHELAFLFVQVGVEGGEDLDATTVGEMTKRLREWQPSDADAEARRLVRRAIDALADRSEDSLVHDSVTALHDALSPVQQLLVLDDLHRIVRVNGTPTPTQYRRLRTLADTWEINIRLDGDEKASADDGPSSS